MSYSDFNLAVDPFIPVNDGAGRNWLTLSGFLAFDRAARIDHPMAALNTPLLMLVTALAQHQQDAIGGVSAKSLQNALLKGDGFDYAWLQSPKLDGLNLFGDAAFMQVPQHWAVASGVEFRSAEGLFRPFRTEGGKALRLPVNRIKAVCRACAATALFFKNSFTAPMAQYWGRSGVAGLLVVMHQVVKDRFYDLPLSVALNLTVDGTPEDYPWQSGEATLIDAICAAPSSKLTQSAALLPLVRAQRLEEPTTSGTCDCCGRQHQPLISQFREIGEPTAFGSLDESLRDRILVVASKASVARALIGITTETTDTSENETKDKKKEAAFRGAKLFTMMYADVEIRRHPSVPYFLSKEGKQVPVIHSEGIDDATQMSPTWTRLTNILARGSMPTLKNLSSTDASISGLSRAVKKKIAHQLYTIVAESGTNPSPKYIADDTYSILYADDSIQNTEDICIVVEKLADTTRDLIYIIAASAAFLFKEVVVEHDSIGLKSDSFLNPTGTAKRLASVRTAAAHLWASAFISVNQAAQETREDVDALKTIDSMIEKQIAVLESTARVLWSVIEKMEYAGDLSARDLYRQARATKEFNKQMAMLLKKRFESDVALTSPETPASQLQEI
jgi:hypothetical protein